MVEELVSLALDICDRDINAFTGDGISLEAQLADSIAGRVVIAGAVPFVEPLVVFAVVIFLGANSRDFALTGVGVQSIPIEATSSFGLIYFMSALTGIHIEQLVFKAGARHRRGSSAFTGVGVLLVTSQAFLEASRDFHVRGVLNSLEEV